MIPVEELAKGSMIEFAGAIWRVSTLTFIEPSKGAAYVEVQLKNINTGERKEAHFQKDETILEARLDKEYVQYLYQSGELHVFMRLDTYEQIEIPDVQIKEDILYFPESSEVVLLKDKEDFLGLELPSVVTLAVLSTTIDPLASNSKAAVLETGMTVSVPFFINQGDKVRIDTSDGSYVSRV